MRIGIFDSGLGGLTVAKAIRLALPTADLFYFGDTARVPYGIKSAESVNRYSLEISKYLRHTRNVDMIVAACNTVSATAIPLLNERFPELTVYDVITAAIERIRKEAKADAHIAVIGTLATIQSGAYEKRLDIARPDVKVQSIACPLLVPLAEEGWIDHPVSRKTIEIYLEPLLENPPDYLILGCTHYPLFRPLFEAFFMDHPTELIDSAETVAKALKKHEKAHDLQGGGCMDVTVSDYPQRFEPLMKQFLGIKPDFISRHSF